VCSFSAVGRTICVWLQDVVGALGAMGSVGVVAVTWAWSLPPIHPREVNEILGDTPRPPAERDSPSLHSPSVRAVCGMNPAAFRRGALGAMGSVGVVVATWAWLLPPTRPRRVTEIQGHVP